MISVSASFASNVNENISSKEVEKSSNITNSKNTNISFQSNTTNGNIFNTKIFAAGDNDRPNDLSQSDIIAASQDVDELISQNRKLPNHVRIANYTYSMPEFLYLLAKTVEYKCEKNNAQIIVLYNVKNPTKPTGVDIKGKISQKDFHDYTKRVANFISSKGRAPNYVSTPLGNIQYQTIIVSFIKILEKKNLPNSLSINIKKSSEINKFMPNYSRTVPKPSKPSEPSKPINEKYNGESLEQYLQVSKNCQVDDKTIQLLALSLTSEYKTIYQNAEAIFNFVNNNIIYSFYYNTKHGAKNTLSKKIGNCVDKSHLIIALSRAVDIPARYVHGTCNFVSGRTYGHVWAQLLVGNTWTAADPSHSKLNRLGAINSWNTNSYTLKGIYHEIRF